MISLPTVSFLVFLFSGSVGAPAQNQVSLVDDLGRTVTLASPAQRVVSLAPSVTESLFAIGAGGQVVGVTDYCSYPPEARMKPRVGGMINPSIEAIVDLKPDLIIVSMEGNMRADFLALTGRGIPVYASNPRTMEGIMRSLGQLGALTGRSAEADSTIRGMKARTERVRARTAGIRKGTLLLVSLQPLVVVGRNTFLNELLELAGADNLAARLHATYPVYSRETLLAEDPDVLLIMSDVIGDLSDLTILFPEWNRLSAFRRHHIRRVNADILSRPGPRAVEGLEALYEIFHERNK